MWKATGRKPEQLANVPELPPLLAYLWQYFCTLQGAEPLSYAEIQSWSALNGYNIPGHEAEVLHRLGRLYQEAARDDESDENADGRFKPNH